METSYKSDSPKSSVNPHATKQVIKGLKPVLDRQGVIFWPDMTNEIRHLTNHCSTCNEFTAKQQKEPLMLSEAPTAPWPMVIQDLFIFAGKAFVLHRYDILPIFQYCT